LPSNMVFKLSGITTDSTNQYNALYPNGYVGGEPQYCLTCEYARANNLVAKRFIANATYSAPPLWHALPAVLGRGWELAGIFNWQTGSPFSIVSPYGTEQFGYDNYNGTGARPFFVQTAPRNPDHDNAQFFASDVVNNPAAYWSVPTTTNATLGTVQTAPGNLGRNTYTGPSWWNLDFSLVKNTTIFKEAKLQLRGEFFNIFNHTTFAIPNGNILTPSFGLSTATAYNERQIQLGARILF